MVLAGGTGRTLIEGTTVGQTTQGREWCFIGLEAAGYPASRHGDFPLRRGVMFMLQLGPLLLLEPRMQLGPLLKFEPLMQFGSLPQLEPGG